MQDELPTQYEELGLGAWPALQSVYYDGWVLRFAKGYTKRANSVSPLYPSTIDVDEKVHVCEQLYRRKFLPAMFKLTPSSKPDTLDARLEQRGYKRDSPTSVQSCDLSGFEPRPARASRIVYGPTEEWMQAWGRMSGVPASNLATKQQMLNNLWLPAGLCPVPEEGQIVACGLGVTQAEYVGLFDIVTDHRYRNRGFARQLIVDLIAWGIELGARTAYLQVTADNAPALHLYSKLGFQERYQYWYRIQPA
ncbi:MAG: GNAT family N-acetyltransferase [Chloroflexi bacterium]|nr:GNAT family N-acetyltransferase [Chloroflexota bacterium]